MSTVAIPVCVTLDSQEILTLKIVKVEQAEHANTSGIKMIFFWQILMNVLSMILATTMLFVITLLEALPVIVCLAS